MSKKFYILTLGCQMNKNDSERIAGLLTMLGMTATEHADEADIIIVNTCSVRQTAENRIFGMQENWKKYRVLRPHLIVGITGCMAGRDHDGKIRARLSEVNLFFGIDELVRLPEWIQERWGEIPGAHRLEDYLLIAPLRTNRFQNFITIQTGCNNFCTYCVVPYARGRERNRPVAEILREVRDAVNPANGDGTKEITLLGQVVNHYIAPDKNNFSKDNPFAGRDDFAALLWEINQIPGEFRIHFTAPDPQYFSDAQVEALSLPKQVNYLHLPVQSGDDELLKKMNRKYTRAQYIEIIQKIRAQRPEIALGTDIIVGFSGETDAQFQNTFDLYHVCDFDLSYHAMYSERSGTAAAKALPDDVPGEVKKQRWDILQKYMEARTLVKNQKYLGATVRILVERCNDGVCEGNSDEMKLVQCPGGEEMIGKFVKVKINFAEKWVLRGTVEK